MYFLGLHIGKYILQFQQHKETKYVQERILSVKISIVTEVLLIFEFLRIASILDLTESQKTRYYI